MQYSLLPILSFSVISSDQTICARFVVKAKTYNYLLLWVHLFCLIRCCQLKFILWYSLHMLFVADRFHPRTIPVCWKIPVGWMGYGVFCHPSDSTSCDLTRVPFLNSFTYPEEWVFNVQHARIHNSQTCIYIYIYYFSEISRKITLCNSLIVKVIAAYCWNKDFQI